jgi:hypothetical protein
MARFLRTINQLTHQFQPWSGEIMYPTSPVLKVHSLESRSDGST